MSFIYFSLCGKLDQAMCYRRCATGDSLICKIDVVVSIEPHIYEEYFELFTF